VAVLHGDPDDLVTLEQYGIKTCSRIVLLSSLSSHDEAPLVDCRILLRANKIENYLRKAGIQPFDFFNDRFCVYELQHAENVVMLPATYLDEHTDGDNEASTLGKTICGSKTCMERCRKFWQVLTCKELDSRAGWYNSRINAIYFSSRTMNGSLMVSNRIASVFGSSYYNPGSMQIFTSLIDPRHARLSGSKVLVPWRVQLPPTVNGQRYTYLQLLKQLVHGLETDSAERVKALPLGLLRARCKNESTPNNSFVNQDGLLGRLNSLNTLKSSLSADSALAGQNSMGFVYTNPPQGTIIAEDDCACILGGLDFGELIGQKSVLRESYLSPWDYPTHYT